MKDAPFREIEEATMRPQKDDTTFVMAAPTGARRGKDAHPNLPITTQEIASETMACRSSGAHALHLHVRDEDGRHSLDPGLYREALQEIERAVPGFPVQVTTESASRFDVETQLNCLRDVSAQAASISVREMARDPELAPRVYALCADRGIHVQHILYTLEDWHKLQVWRASGIVHQNQTDVIVVLGQYAPARYTKVQDLDAVARIIDGAPGRCMVCAFGPNEHRVLLAAAARGCDLRIGFENNIHAEDGTLASSNAAQVAHLVSALASVSLEGGH